MRYKVIDLGVRREWDDMLDTVPRVLRNWYDDFQIGVGNDAGEAFDFACAMLVTRGHDMDGAQFDSYGKVRSVDVETEHDVFNYVAVGVRE